MNRLIVVAIVASTLKAGLAFGGVVTMEVRAPAPDRGTACEQSVYTGAGDRGR